MQMKVSVLTVLFLLLIMGKKASGQDRDSIILYNGQVLIGDVQQASLGSISIDDIDLKIVNIKLFKIRKLIIRERFKIETIERNIFYGTLKTTDKEGWVTIHPVEGGDVEVHITHIYQLTSMEHNFFKRLNGNVSAGLSFTKSSNIGQLNFSGNAIYSTKKLSYQLSASTIGSIDSTGYSRDNENLQLLTTYELNTTWFLAASAQYQRNLELAILHRYLVMGGGGNKLFIKKTWRLLGITGISLSEEKSTEGVSSNLLYEIPVSFIFNFYKFHNPDIQINSTQTVYFSLSQPGRVRYEGNTSFSWQLIRYFYLNINPYANFDNQPPGGGSTFDYGIVFGLSYKF
jgi:hypothetical protein